MSSNSRPLAAPGAGLPRFEAWLLRHVLFPLARRMTEETAIEKFIGEGRRILTVVRSLDAEQQQRRTRVRRVTALEDSSREWSARMVIEHLMITGPAMLGAARSLAAGIVPQRQVKISDLKPKGESGPEVLDDFKKLLEGYTGRATGLSKPGQPTFAHPWFGELDAHGWLVLNGFHQSIHRTQVERIVASLAE